MQVQELSRNCAVDVYRTDLQSFSSNVSDKKIFV